MNWSPAMSMLLCDVCVLFADFPYELNDKTERHYQVVFYLIFKLMGQFCDAEVRSAKGRADAVVKTGEYIYVFEFKLDGSIEDALQQINDKGYLLPYQIDHRKLIKVGVSFDRKERNIGEWESSMISNSFLTLTDLAIKIKIMLRVQKTNLGKLFFINNIQ